MGKILITPRSLSDGHHPSLQKLLDAGLSIVAPAPGQMPSPQQLKEALPGCIGWLAGVEPVSEDVIDHAHALRVISRNGSGIDNLPVEYLHKKGIDLKTAVGSNARGVAELTLGLMLAALRNIPLCDRTIRDGDWPRIRGRELSSLTIGIVGLGAIGRAVADLCLALGSRVIAHDPFVNGTCVGLDAVELRNLPDLFSSADVVTFHCPATADGRPLFGQSEVDRAKRGVILVNTARASLIDDDAVLEGLESGHVFALATDVFEAEPPTLTPLIQHERVILTSHIGGFTDESVERSTDAAIENLLASLTEAR